MVCPIKNTFLFRYISTLSNAVYARYNTLCIITPRGPNTIFILFISCTTKCKYKLMVHLKAHRWINYIQYSILKNRPTQCVIIIGQVLYSNYFTFCCNINTYRGFIIIILIFPFVSIYERFGCAFSSHTFSYVSQNIH